MKQCTKCLIYKPLTDYCKGTKYKDKLQKHCKACNKAYREQHKAHINVKAKAYREQNKESILRYLATYRDKHRKKASDYNKHWRENNRGLRNAYEAKRKSSMLQRTPKWLTDDDLRTIKAIYKSAAIKTKQTGILWHVDHIIPLQGQTVCGLHVPSNLQIILWIDNLKKGTKLYGDDTRKESKK